MSQMAAVLVGADTVFADGAVVNKVGTLALALLARRTAGALLRGHARA